MMMGSFVKTKTGLVVVSSTITIILFVGLFEIIKNVQYYRWKADFDNYGWFGKITIPSPNPILMWEYRPHGEISQIKTDRYGFRNLDIDSTVKPDNAVRIAFTGDSVTLGLGVSREQTFVHQFEVGSRQSTIPGILEAFNFAVDGYSTPQILEMVRTNVLQFAPDSVVYVMCLNDFDFTQSSGSKIKYFRKPRSFFLNEIDKVKRRLHGNDFHQYAYKKNRNSVFQSIIDMKNLVEQANITFRVVVLPVFPESPLTFDDYPVHNIHEALDSFFRQNGIQFVDLLDAFRESGQLPQYYASDAWHPNIEGHAFIAQQLLSSLPVSGETQQ